LGLYSGFNYHLLRDTIGTGVYFMTYESVKQILANARGENPASPEAVVLAGGACGLVSWACVCRNFHKVDVSFWADDKY
jgi:solute carrier family 25 carnitine/acylcarnitine transporter 20/29